MGNQSYRQGSDWSSTEHRTEPLPTQDPNASSWGNGFVASQVNTGLTGEDGTGSFGESLVDMVHRTQGSGTPAGMKGTFQSREGWAGGLGFGYGNGFWGSQGGYSRGEGLGLGIGGNQWTRSVANQDTGEVQRTEQGVGFGGGGMMHSQTAGSLWGFGGSGSADLYGGGGGNAYQFQQGNRTGAGVNGQYGYGVNNVALNTSTPWSNSSTTVENANVRMRAASVEGYRTDEGGYGVQGTYSGGPKVSVSGVEHHNEGPLGTTDVSLGNYTSGLRFSDGLPTRISRGGVEVGPDGSVTANAGATGGGFRAENLRVNHDFGGGNRVGGGFDSVDTNNSWDASLGWNNTTNNVEFNGQASTGYTVRGANVNADGPWGYRGEASVGQVTGGGWNANGTATLGADGLHAQGGGQWGGVTAEDINFSSGWDGVYETSGHVGNVTTANSVTGGELHVDGDGLRAGMQEARFGGVTVNDASVQNELFGVTTNASVGQVTTANVLQGGSLAIDENGLRAGMDHGEFGGVSVDDVALSSDLGGYGTANAHLGHFDNRAASFDGARLNVDETGLHAGVERLGIGGMNIQDAGWDVQGPGGLHSNASLGDLSTGFTGEGLYLDATSEGVNLGARELSYATVQGNDLHVSGGIDGVMESSLDLGHGHYNQAGAENVRLGVSNDGTASLSADNAHYSYVGLEDLHARQSYLGGALGTEVDLGEGNLLGASADHIEGWRNGDRAHSSVDGLNAHGLQMSDVNIGANVGDLNANVGADTLNALDLNVGHAESTTSMYGLQGTGSVTDANLDILNAEGLNAGLSWDGQEIASATTDLRANAGVEQADGTWDATNGTASGSFTNAHAGLMTDNTRLSVGGYGVDIGRTGVNLNASGSGNVDLFNGQANGNINLAGSEVSLFGHSVTAPEWAQAQGSVDLGQGAVSAQLGGENGVGADVNLSEGNFDVNAFGYELDVDEGIRDVGNAISDGAGAVADGAKAAWDFATSW